jgi:Cu-Zn family superoxide dismutase
MAGKHHLVAVVALGAGATALGAVAAEKMSGQPEMTGGAVIKNIGGRTVGSLRIDDEGRGKSKVSITSTGLPPGYHGFHIHKKGVCDPKSADPKTGSLFFSAGPHFDLGSHSHPKHSGDLPDLLVNADGTGQATFVTDRFTMRRLLDADGSAIIIHAMPDNQANVPSRYSSSAPDAESRKTGDSGARIACGAIGKR